MRFEDKKVVITGGASGIGAAMCLEFAAEGADIAILEVDLGSAERVVGQVKQTGREAIALKADVASFTGVHSAIKRVYKELGRVDILVNNAGMPQYVDFAEMTEEMWDRMIAVKGMNDQAGRATD